jgi:hypothetical protein
LLACLLACLPVCLFACLVHSRVSKFIDVVCHCCCLAYPCLFILKLERALRLEQESSAIHREQQLLQEQISRLKHQLSEQSEEHENDVRGYQDSQEKQAILVQKLQSKVI